MVSVDPNYCSWLCADDGTAMVSRIEGFEQAIEGNKVSATKEG